MTTISIPTPPLSVAKPPERCSGHVVMVYPNGGQVIEHPAGMYGRRACPVHGRPR